MKIRLSITVSWSRTRRVLEEGAGRVKVGFRSETVLIWSVPEPTVREPRGVPEGDSGSRRHLALWVELVLSPSFTTRRPSVVRGFVVRTSRTRAVEEKLWLTSGSFTLVHVDFHLFHRLWSRGRSGSHLLLTDPYH